MKKVKRIVALVLALMMIMSVMAMAVSAATTLPNSVSCSDCSNPAPRKTLVPTYGAWREEYCTHGTGGMDRVRTVNLDALYYCDDCGLYMSRHTSYDERVHVG